jgi:transcriptional regulator with XRE-family HTH domain
MIYTMRTTQSLQYQRFLKLLRSARHGSGKTQVQVAKLLKKPQSFVSKSESGERRVDVVDLQQFAKIYKRPFSYFE